MLVKMNEPANSEVELVAATLRTTRANGKAPAGTTVEVVDRAILPVDGFGTAEVDLDQPGISTKPMKMVSVAYVPGRLWNLPSTGKAGEQWGKPLVYYKVKAVLGFPGEESLVFNFCPHKALFFATGVRRTPSQGETLGLGAKTAETMRIEATGQWAPCTDVRRGPNQGKALAVAAKACDIVEVHRVLAHTSEEITQKMAQAIGIATTRQWGFCEARLQVEAKWQAVQ